MGKFFNTSETNDVVIKLIKEQYQSRPRWVTREELVSAFQRDRRGEGLAAQAMERQQQVKGKAGAFRRSKEDMIGNMIDWFSSDYNRGKPSVTRDFDRTKIGSHWAYRPRSAEGGFAESADRTTEVDGIAQQVVLADGSSAEADAEQQAEIRGARFHLERNLQAALRASIDQLEPGLRIVDGGREHVTETGRVDVLAEDEEGKLVVIELKAGTADDAVVGQILGYMGSVSDERSRPVRGILIAADFTAGLRHAARMVPTLQLRKYSFKFAFEEVS